MDLKERREFMLNFSNNPTEFLNRFIASCIQDSKVKNGKNLIHNFNLKKKHYRLQLPLQNKVKKLKEKQLFIINHI